MRYAEEGALDLESDLREHFQLEAVRDLEDLKRRVVSLEAKLGITSEGQYGKGRALVAEGDQEDPQVLTIEELGDWGVPLAPSMDGGRSMVVSEPLAAGFDAYSRGSAPSGELVTGDAAQRLSAILAESQANRQDPDEEADGVLRPDQFAGVRPARGF